MTATEASRKFSDLLDAVEAGETVEIVRGGRTVATVSPPLRPNGRALREALEALGPREDDPHFAKDIADGLAILTPWENPWPDD